MYRARPQKSWRYLLSERYSAGVEDSIGNDADFCTALIHRCCAQALASSNEVTKHLESQASAAVEDEHLLAKAMLDCLQGLAYQPRNSRRNSISPKSVLNAFR